MGVMRRNKEEAWRFALRLVITILTTPEGIFELLGVTFVFAAVATVALAVGVASGAVQ